MAWDFFCSVRSSTTFLVVSTILGKNLVLIGLQNRGEVGRGFINIISSLIAASTDLSCNGTRDVKKMFSSVLFPSSLSKVWLNLLCPEVSLELSKLIEIDKCYHLQGF